MRGCGDDREVAVYLVIHSDALKKDGSAKVIGKALSYETKLPNMFKVPEFVTPFAEKENVTLVLEPMNTRAGQPRAHQNYFLEYPQPALDLTGQIGSDYVRSILWDTPDSLDLKT